jgi:hypothetical protein
VPQSKPLKSVTYLLRLSPAEKARMEELAAEFDLTLAHVLRRGAALYLEDLKRTTPATEGKRDGRLAT